jgi:hypothetical protein
MPPNRRSRSTAPRAAAALLALLAAACVDSPTGAPPPTPPAPPGEPGEPITLQEVVCTASRADLTVACTAPRDDLGANADVLYGGQGVYVTLASTNVAYNGGTGQFTFDVTVNNLIPQPIGTTDGTSVDPNGVRVFFMSGPTVTGGTGVASVVPDGFGTFTAVGQPYYQYSQMVAPSATSSARTWTLIMPPTVTTFNFVVAISSPVEYPDGYVELDGLLPDGSIGTLQPPNTHPLTAVVRTALGTVVATSVTFGTSDPDCATVSGGGVVTGVRAATCDITAAATVAGNPVEGLVTVDVTGITRVWEGDVSSDWNVGGNWAGGLVPAAVDSVSIPVVGGGSVYPALSSAVSIGGVTVADLATLSLGAFDLTANNDVGTGATAGSGILGTGGRLLLAGAGAAHGRVPTILVTGAYGLDGDLFVVAPGEVDLGELSSESYELQIESQ